MRSSALAIALCVTALAADGRAQPQPDDTPYRWTFEVDLPVMGVAAATASIAFIELPSASCLPDCAPPDDLNALDRTVLGFHSPTAHTFHTRKRSTTDCWSQAGRRRSSISRPSRADTRFGPEISPT